MIFTNNGIQTKTLREIYFVNLKTTRKRMESDIAQDSP